MPRNMTKRSATIPVSSWILVAGLGIAPTLGWAATPARFETERIVWDHGAQVYLPKGAHYGSRLAAGWASGEFAIVGAPGRGGKAELYFDGVGWPVDPFDHQTTKPSFEPEDSLAVGLDGTTAGLVRSWSTLSGNSSGVTSEPYVPGGGEPTPVLLVSGIDGGPVESVAKYGTTLLVGQPSWGAGAGRVLIYELNQQFGWLLAETVVGSTGYAMGTSVALADFDVAFLGAPGAGPGGRVKVWARTGPESWIEAATFDSPSGGQAESPEFGTAVAAVGPWVVIGSPKVDRLLAGGGVEADIGSVYVYESELFGWSLHSGLRPPEEGGGDLHGSSLDLRILPSGRTVLVTGSPGEDTGLSGGNLDEGAAYFWELEDDEWKLRWRLLDAHPHDGEALGTTVAIAGKGVLSGAPFYNGNDVPEQGAVLYFWLPIFADGFESGDTSLWSAEVP